MNDEERDLDWQCSVCKEWKPIKPLARECERRHAAQAEERA